MVSLQVCKSHVKAMASIRRRLRFETVPTSGGGNCKGVYVFAPMPGKAKVHKIMRDMLGDEEKKKEKGKKGGST